MHIPYLELLFYALSVYNYIKSRKNAQIFLKGIELMELFRPAYYDNLMDAFVCVAMHQMFAKQRNNDVHRLLSAIYKLFMIVSELDKLWSGDHETIEFCSLYRSL